MQRFQTVLSVSFASIFAGAFPALAAPPTYTIQNIDTVDGLHVTGLLEAMNDHGVLLGIYWEPTFGFYTGTADNPTKFNASLTPYGLNNYGDFVGSVSLPNTNYNFSAIWKDDVLTLLPALPGMELHSIANLINSDGEIAGTGTILSTTSSPQITVAYLFKPTTRRGVTGNIIQIPGGVTSNGPLGLNDYGEVCGSFDNTAGNPDSAYVWVPSTPEGTIGQLVTINGYGSGYNAAVSINKYGTAVGVSEDSSNNTATSIAFVWTPDTPNGTTGNTSLLPTFSGTSTGYTPSSINNKGQIVGTGPEGATLWEGSHVYYLNKLVPPDSGWNLQNAEAINNAGQITCFGEYHHKPSSCVLTPVTP
jgi:hypothetical protein